jgi:hypothetical protein
LPTSLAFRPHTTELAFLARDATGHKRVVVGERISGPFDDIEGNRIVFSAEASSWGYTGRRGATSIVVIDGVEQHHETWASRPVFSADGKHVAYAARRGRRMAVLIDGNAHDADIVIDGTFAFSADGRHWACLAGTTKDRELFFLVDGHRQAPLDFEEVVSASGRFSMQQVLGGRADDVLRSWAEAEAELASANERATTTPR